MIKELRVRNFKSIKKVSLNFGKLNVLCGENASGKTSIIHSVLIAAQKNDDDYVAEGKIIKIGDISELKNNESGQGFSISLICNNGSKTITVKKNENIEVNKSEKLTVQATDDKIISYEENLFYLSSNRVGVADTHSKGNGFFGVNGESVIDFLYQQRDEQMSQTYMSLFNKTYPGTKIAENRKFIEHVRFWMEKITAETITINSVANTNQYVLLFGNNIRPINTGSGYSFLLQIIIVCLGAILIGKEISTVILENPEIYLHPEAQKKLVEFFLLCKNFIQIIIESHSEHILEEVIKKKNRDCKIFVVKLEKQETTVAPLTHENFKTNPIAYPEVIYKAFGILTTELHVILYGQLQSQYNASIKKESSLACFDKYLSSLPGVCKKDWIKSNHSQTQYTTLPTFIRNKIDHPEAKNPTTNKPYSYSVDELKKSIDWMLSQL